jgi:hypothetical protein
MDKVPQGFLARVSVTPASCQGPLFLLLYASQLLASQGPASHSAGVRCQTQQGRQKHP